PTASAFWRVALAAPLLWPLLLAAPRAPAARPSAALLLGAGFAFAGDLAFWHWSIRFTSVANSTLLANLASLFVTLAMWLFWRSPAAAERARVAHAPRARVDFALRGAGADRLFARAPGRGVLVGEPAVSARDGGRVRLAAAQ